MTAWRGAAAVLTAALMLALVGCATTPQPVPPPRTTANTVERAAVQRTTQELSAETGDARLPWVQLWTSAQFPVALQHCVGVESHGQLSARVDLPEFTLRYSIVGSGSWPDEAESARIIARCAAATPLDDRVLHLPRADWDALYSYELTTLRPCLLARGYHVSRMPSRVDFEQRLRDRHPWSPYDTVSVPTRFAWYALSDACPALPASLAGSVSED
jgi:hypothetical protein